MPLLLLFNLSAQKRAAVHLAAMQCACRCAVVEPESFGATLDQLAAEQRPRLPVQQPFTEELLVMANFRGGQLDELLDRLRQGGVSVALKAVLTPTNAAWTAQALYEELCRERAAFAAAGKQRGGCQST